MQSARARAHLRERSPLISHEHRCIFIHIPKCAGTSVEVALGHWEGHEGWGGQDHRTIRMIEPFPIVSAFSSVENMHEVLHRQKYRHVTKIYNPKNSYTVTRDQYRSYLKFTIVRNPWARAFSWYQNVLRDPKHRASYGIEEDISLSQFLDRFVGRWALRPQPYWIRAFDGSIPMDYIARFENLAADLEEVFDRLGLDHGSIPHEQKGSGEDYKAHYDDAANEIVMRAFNEDIEMFGYSFESG